MWFSLARDKSKPSKHCSSSHGILFTSVAVMTTDLQFSRMVAFFHADERPIFSSLRSASIARSQVSLCVPTGCFQSGGLPLQLNGVDLHWPSCGHMAKEAVFCQLPHKTEAGNLKYAGLRCWLNVRCMEFEGPSKWPTCQIRQEGHTGTS